MADAPEIPEATDPFEKRVAISIAALAVVLSLVGNLGDNAKTDAILKTNEAANAYAFYQAKSTKQNIAELHRDLVTELGSTMPKEEREKAVARQQAEATRYENEKSPLLPKAKGFEDEAKHNSEINDACDLSCLFLQIGVVVCSVAILSRWKAIWFAGLALGAAGTVWGIRAFLM